jgi:hypothetical protein
MESPQTTKNRPAIWVVWAIPLLGIYPKEYESAYNKYTYTLMFIAALFTKLTYGNIHDAPLLANGLRNSGIYIQWGFIQPQRRMKFCHLQ